MKFGLDIVNTGCAELSRLSLLQGSYEVFAEFQVEAVLLQAVGTR